MYMRIWFTTVLSLLSGRMVISKGLASDCLHEGIIYSYVALGK